MGPTEEPLYCGHLQYGPNRGTSLLLTPMGPTEEPLYCRHLWAQQRNLSIVDTYGPNRGTSLLWTPMGPTEEPLCC